MLAPDIDTPADIDDETDDIAGPDFRSGGFILDQKAADRRCFIAQGVFNVGDIHAHTDLMPLDALEHFYRSFLITGALQWYLHHQFIHG
ncbi:hypothetical protein LP421_00770 (plasmid) [Rhizobium sp. RCAM05350]|nr:hypothetical protein LP421_00770 [Rhizobium sp. RCAM05350]